MQKSSVKRIGVVVIGYCVLAVLFFWVVREGWTQRDVSSDAVNPVSYLGDLSSGVIEQTITVPMDELRELAVRPAAYGADTSGELRFQILDEGKNEVWACAVPAGELRYGEMHPLAVEPAITGAKNRRYTLRITGEGIPQGTGATVWYGTTQEAGRYDIAISTDEVLTLNGTQVEGMLVLEMKGADNMRAAGLFWPVCVALGALIAAFAVFYETRRSRNPQSGLFRAEDMLKKYSYLLRQLVMRDFKVKYKASALGMLWSFLNPLLMMAVYYFVFSTLFRSNIENFTVYLITGIVLFNYFSESTALGLLAIVGNASLITKVYVPKYIYPISKSLSSAINMMISMVPVLLIMLLTGVHLTKALLLLPFVLGCLILFSMGMCMLLSTSMAFFRDTQFLWSVLVTMWNFLTPIFYPESIIPQKMAFFYRLNPMYQFVSFMRSICIDGLTPAPGAYLGCILAAVIPFVIGFVVFRRNQDEFVLHL